MLGTLGPTAARSTGNHSEELSREQPINTRIPVCSGGQRSASVAFLPGGEPSQEPLPRLGSMWGEQKGCLKLPAQQDAEAFTGNRLQWGKGRSMPSPDGRWDGE